MSGLTKRVIKGKVVFLKNNNRITPSEYYKLRYEKSKKG
jgi:hypothetical protein